MKRLIYITIAITTCLQVVNGQITIRETKIIEKEVPRPEPFDSLTNFKDQIRSIDYKKYIGYELYFLPKSKILKKETKEKEETIDSLRGKYFTILNIEACKSYSSEEYIKLEDAISPHKLKVWLLNDINNDTTFWEVSKSELIVGIPALLVPYFEKQKNTLQNKYWIVADCNDFWFNPNCNNYSLHSVHDYYSDEWLSLNSGDEWYCYDVSLMDSESGFIPFAFFRKGKQEIALPLTRVISPSKGTNELFISKEKLTSQKQKREKEIEIEKQKLIAKWGKELGSLIAEEKVRIGMNKEMCKDAWGAPIRINTTTTRNIISEQWVYGGGNYLYFENGILTTIQN